MGIFLKFFIDIVLIQGLTSKIARTFMWGGDVLLIYKKKKNQFPSQQI